MVAGLRNQSFFSVNYFRKPGNQLFFPGATEGSTRVLH